MITGPTTLPAFGLTHAAAAMTGFSLPVGGASCLGGCIDGLNRMKSDPKNFSAADLGELLSSVHLAHILEKPGIRLSDEIGLKDLADGIILPLSERAKSLGGGIQRRKVGVPLFAAKPDAPLIHMGLRAPGLARAVVGGWLKPAAAAALASELSANLYANVLMLSDLDRRIGEYDRLAFFTAFQTIFLAGVAGVIALDAGLKGRIGMLSCLLSVFIILKGCVQIKRASDNRDNSIGLFDELPRNRSEARRHVRAALGRQLELLMEYRDHYGNFLMIDNVAELRRTGILPIPI